MEVRILDESGGEQSWPWLASRFGNIIVHQPETKPAWYVTQLRASYGPSSLEVWKHPYTMVRRVAFSWPDAPTETSLLEPKPLAYYEAPPDGHADVSFAMGQGSYYDPNVEIGPHCVWIEELDETFELLRSGWVDGLGMVSGTAHYHLNVTFKWLEADPETVEQRVLDEADALRNLMRLPMPLSFTGPAVLKEHGFGQAAGFDHFEHDSAMYWWQIGFDPAARMAIVFGPEADYDRWTLLIYECSWDEENQLQRKLVSRIEHP
jgi:hypothetical protein